MSIPVDENFARAAVRITGGSGRDRAGSADLDADIVAHGAAIAHRYAIRCRDGAIVAAAHVAGAATLYSEDLNDGQRYGEIAVVNPFKSVSHQAGKARA